MAKTVTMRGLQNFIQDIRGCENREQEQRRVEKELAKIRGKFGEDKALSCTQMLCTGLVALLLAVFVFHALHLRQQARHVGEQISMHPAGHGALLRLDLDAGGI